MVGGCSWAKGVLGDSETHADMIMIERPSCWCWSVCASFAFFRLWFVLRMAVKYRHWYCRYLVFEIIIMIDIWIKKIGTHPLNAELMRCRNIECVDGLWWKREQMYQPFLLVWMLLLYIADYIWKGLSTTWMPEITNLVPFSHQPRWFFSSSSSEKSNPGVHTKRRVIQHVFYAPNIIPWYSLAKELAPLARCAVSLLYPSILRADGMLPIGGLVRRPYDAQKFTRRSSSSVGSNLFSLNVKWNVVCILVIHCEHWRQDEG